MGLVLFYTHFWLSRVLTASSLCLDPLYRWYCTVSSLMRGRFFSFLFFSASVVALAAVRGDKGKYLVGDGGVCLGISLSVWFEYLSFETMISSDALIFL